MVGEAKSRLESDPRPARDAQRAQTKPCAHPDPEKGAVTSARDGVRPAFECLSVSSGGTGQQWPAMGTGALAEADLGGAACGINPLGGVHH